MDFSDAFAAVLKHHRIACGLSKEALAQRAGLHQTYVGLLERGLRNPSLDVAHSLARGLNLPLSQMIVEAEGQWQAKAVKRIRGDRRNV
jgi:DNA-binding XRE family transcriptional regulator